MSRKSGQVKRFISRFFKERQIYHRSDGVVHFISMSTKTQIALATVVGSALLWIAYSSVNVVFKEQIIVAKESASRRMEKDYSLQIVKQQQAYAEIDHLNQTMEAQFKETMEEFSGRHQSLKNMVERAATSTQNIETLAENLSEAGAPNGQKPENGNRIMIDVMPAEPSPRQSRIGSLKRRAIDEAARQRNIEIPDDSPASEAFDKMDRAAADLFVEQMLLLASLEERATETAQELKLIMASAGIRSGNFTNPSKIRNTNLAQGGPFLPAGNLSDADSLFFKHATRAELLVEELQIMEKTITSLPLSSPLTGSRLFTSGFGVRRDPINGRRTNHFGIDFAAAWASPITATASGVVKFAGTRSGFGRVVEIDHGNGFVTRYAHLNRYTVKKGQKVKLHDKIGELGSSGRSTGPHVHYEILYNGKPRNPQRFIEAGRYVFES